MGLLLLGMSLGATAAQAQTTAVERGPVLLRRGAGTDSYQPRTSSRGRTTLPEEASGEYALGGPGEVVELELSHDRLSGYISRMGDQQSDEGTPLTYFFSTATLGQERLQFATQQVHGRWFSFEGTVRRGAASARTQPGYYVLDGTLAMHDAMSGASQSRRVALPLARDYSGN